jgi:hypothetical protein
LRQATFRLAIRLTAGARLGRAAVVCLLVAAASAHASAQTRVAETPSPSPQQPTQRAGATADEAFELNIDVRRIGESDFRAETAVEAGSASGVRLKVGVALWAQDIEVLLQGVRGRVRFRGNLAPVLRLLDARRGTSPATQSPPPPSP